MASASARVAAALLAAACLAILSLAAWLKPNAAGHGTHRSLGLPNCGWVVTIGKPCPTCGMTTAFAHAAHRSPVKALTAQPMGALLALMTAGGFWASVHVAVTGSRLGSLVGSMMSARVLWALGALTAAAWAYKLATWPG
jgi:hypothetical protein